MRSDSGSRRDFARIVHDDSYRLRAFPAGFFTHVVDVGANIGAFSLLARCLNPRAQILALEPDARTFQMLRENTELFRVNALQAALGDGRPVAALHIEDDMSVRNIYQSEGRGTGAVSSMRLGEVLDRAAVDAQSICYLKVDCEGAERYLVELGEHEAVRRAAVLAIELHYRPPAAGPSVDEHVKVRTRLTFDAYKAFLDEALAETHVPVLPWASREIGVSEHLFVHRRHLHVFMAGRGAFPELELTSWRAGWLVGQVASIDPSRPLFLWGDNSLSRMVRTSLASVGRSVGGLIDRRGDGSAILNPDAFWRIAAHAGSRPFVVVCSRVARDEIVSSLERGGFRRGSDCAMLPDEDPQSAPT